MLIAAWGATGEMDRGFGATLQIDDVLIYTGKTVRPLSIDYVATFGIPLKPATKLAA